MLSILLHPFCVLENGGTPECYTAWFWWFGFIIILLTGDTDPPEPPDDFWLLFSQGVSNLYSSCMARGNQFSQTTGSKTLRMLPVTEHTGPSPGRSQAAPDCGVTVCLDLVHFIHAVGTLNTVVPPATQFIPTHQEGIILQNSAVNRRKWESQCSLSDTTRSPTEHWSILFHQVSLFRVHFH